jgi:dihydrolipoamide dehydrogenase
MVVLGGGVVGCEYATMFANFGRTKVYIIDRADRILPFEDADIAELVSRRMEDKGITIHRGARLVSMKVVDGEVDYVVEYPKQNNRSATYRVEKALLSIGREPCLTGLGLENAGVTLEKGNKILSDDCQTSVKHIWAAGDSTADVALVNVAELEGRHVVERLFAPVRPPALTYSNISTIMFVDPRVAGVGDNEETLIKRRTPYKVAVYRYSLVARAIAKGNTEGFVKLLVSNDPAMKLLGIRALGAASDAVIEICSFLIKHQRSANDLRDLLTAYPSITEGLQECVRVLYNESIYKKEVFPESIQVAKVTYD